MTQHEMIVDWIKERGSITPAKMVGKIFKGRMFGSEVGKRCRELRASNTLVGSKDGKFAVFKLKTN